MVDFICDAEEMEAMDHVQFCARAALLSVVSGVHWGIGKTNQNGEMEEISHSEWGKQVVTLIRPGYEMPIDYPTKYKNIL